MALCSDQRVRVDVNGTYIPTVEDGVTTEVTSDAQQSGADITRLSEVFVPIEWKDEQITSSIQSFDPTSQSGYDKVLIEWQNVRQGTWTNVHRGFVRGVSGTSDMGVARMIVGDPADLLSAIPFSKRYELPTVQEIFNDVITEFNQNTPFFAEFGGTPSRDVSGGGDPIEGLISDMTFGFLGEGTNLDDKTTFKSNRHSCADALNWATSVSGGKWYFAFTSGNVLRLVHDDGSNSVAFTQRESHGSPQEQKLNSQGSLPNATPNELDIITNDALAELFPINTLTVKGATGTSILGFETSMIPSEKAPYVTVQYPPLVQRAGGNVVADTIETEHVTLQSATNAAKKKLEQRILDSGTGQIECYGHGSPKPYDILSARPECNNVLTSSADPLPYEVASVKHEKKASEEMITFIDVSALVNPGDITVETAEMKDI